MVGWKRLGSTAAFGGDRQRLNSLTISTPGKQEAPGSPGVFHVWVPGGDRATSRHE